MKRIDYIDALKGFAIILVVLGHVIQYYYLPNSFDQNVTFRFIYSFHMPLFFAISGFAHQLSSHIGFSLNVIKRNAIQLLLPFFVWWIIKWIVLNRYNLIYGLLQPDKGLWFLWFLFWIRFFYSVAVEVSQRCHIKVFFSHIGMLTFLILLARLTGGMCGPSLYGYYLFYILGSLLGKYKDYGLNYEEPYFPILVFLMFFLIGANYWYRDINFVPEKYHNDLFLTILSSAPYRYLVATCGIMFSFLFFRKSGGGHFPLIYWKKDVRDICHLWNPNSCVWEIAEQYDIFTF